jgi:cell division protein FtsB
VNQYERDIENLVRAIAALARDNRKLRDRIAQLEEADRWALVAPISIDHETAADKIADINRMIDRIMDNLDAKDPDDPTES